MARDAVAAWIALGANLGDAAGAVTQALQRLGQMDGVTLLARSSLYRSAPVDAGGPDFINAVAQVSTLWPAPVLLDMLQNMEHSMGRERPYPNAPRTLDLDLLLYGQARMDSPRLTVPHPSMGQRAFVLLPLAEISPGLVTAAQLQAVSGQTIMKLSPGI